MEVDSYVFMDMNLFCLSEAEAWSSLLSLSLRAPLHVNWQRVMGDGLRFAGDKVGIESIEASQQEIGFTA